MERMFKGRVRHRAVGKRPSDLFSVERIHIRCASWTAVFLDDGTVSRSCIGILKPPRARQATHTASANPGGGIISHATPEAAFERAVEKNAHPKPPASIMLIRGFPLFAAGCNGTERS